jgi:hypothetical protein
MFTSTASQATDGNRKSKKGQQSKRQRIWRGLAAAPQLRLPGGFFHIILQPLFRVLQGSPQPLGHQSVIAFIHSG